ncbi:MAG: hypothetical protein A2521_05890 [Deltaproteobacteria bacterium RIFOXYD12_FULL_57_12]|nr:MAG: hypothetical protein A2521_05890 [Deltaproteobacteria bacterium RIFOXYD12_FULL_57_12]
MKKHFPVIIEQDGDGVYIVECPILKGCRSYGHTIDEAMKNIGEAIAVSVEDDFQESDISFIGMRDLELAV